MKYEIYLDSLFLITASMNLCLLVLTGKLAGCTATHWAILKGALLGAVLECLLLILPVLPGTAKLWMGYLAVSAGMIQVTFPAKKGKVLLERVLCLYITAFCLGGALQFLSTTVPFWKKREGDLFWLAALAGGVTFLGSCLFEKLRTKKEFLCTAILWDGTKEVAFQALIDSGNSLVDPITGKPVCVLEKKALEGCREICRPEKMRAIPYHSIGRDHGVLIGYEVPVLKIRSEKQDKTICRAIVGLCDHPVSKRGLYQMIVHPALLEE